MKNDEKHRKNNKKTRQKNNITKTTKKRQKNIAKTSMQKHQPSFNNMIVTEITKADTFYKAEEYHQKYIQKRALSE